MCVHNERKLRDDAARLDPLSRPVALTATVLVGVLGVAAFAMGVPGLVQVAGWAGLGGPLAFLLPVVLDGGILISAVAMTVARARREPAGLARATLAGLTVFSVAAQLAHVLVPADALTPRAVWGALVAALAPAVVFLATEMLLSLAIAPPVRRAARRAPAAKAATAPVPAAGVEKPTRKATPARVSDREEARTEVLRLRAEGQPFSAISELTGVAASTAKRWAREAAAADEGVAA